MKKEQTLYETNTDLRKSWKTDLNKYTRSNNGQIDWYKYLSENVVGSPKMLYKNFWSFLSWLQGFGGGGEWWSNFSFP